ncbi:MAG: hypothetical protein ACPGVO_11955 [Spirulinaceae cyanobacterium]
MFDFLRRSLPPNRSVLNHALREKGISRRQAWGRILTVGLLILLVGFATVEDYGVSWDEGTEVAIVKYNYNWITQSQPIPRDLKHYGVVFNGTAELLFQTRQWLADPANYSLKPQLKAAENPRALTEALAQRLRFKHRLTFLWSLAAYAGVLLLVSLLAGMRNAWFAAVVLALMPRFWAHSFFNPKDLPFASLFTLSTALGALLLGAYQRATVPRWGGSAIAFGNASSAVTPRPWLWGWAAGYGVLVGLLTGVRIGGWVVLGFVAIAHLLTGGLRIFHQPRRLVGFYGVMGLAWALTTIAVHPASWPHPLLWFWQTNRYLSHHPWASPVLFRGDYWQAAELPWYYIPWWVGISVPAPWLVATAIGLVLLVVNYRSLTPTQQGATILVLLQAVGLPLAAILAGASVYGGVRQFMFVIAESPSFDNFEDKSFACFT